MIEFKHVTKRFGKDVNAVDDMNLSIETGSFVCLIGTSGSGKTTAMRMINRMEEITSGSITIDGVDIKSMNEVALRREIGYVIQQIGLMPHMTIYENIIMVPKLLGWTEEAMRAKALDLMQRIDLDVALLDAYPSELSGGMQQRVGVIRALAADQKIILMDEPFGALDPITRDSLQHLIKRLQKEMNQTIIFVTHDMDEALLLSDQLVIMSHGKIIQKGTPQEILLNPENDFVRDLIGQDRLNQATFEFDTVEKIMNPNPIYVRIDTPMNEVVRVMIDKKVDDLLIVDDAMRLMGRVDWYALSARRDKALSVKDIMKNVTYVPLHTTIQDAIYYIHDLGYRNLSVVDDQGKLVGIVTRGNVVSEIFEVLWKSYEPELLEDDLSLETPEKVHSIQDVIENGVDVQ